MRRPPFQRLLDLHGEDVYRFCVAAAGRQDADDCFQETMVAALRAYPGLRSTENLRGWLFTVAHSKVMTERRAQARRPVLVAAVPDRAGEAPAEREPALWAAVRRLPPAARAAVLHRYVNDLAYADIAAILGCSEEAARQAAKAGVDRLRREWTP